MVAEYKEIHRSKCIDIFVDNFTNPPFNYEWMRREKIEEYFVDIERQQNFAGFVIYDGTRLIGLCLGAICDYFEATTYEIKEILISREFQNKGHGGAALAQIEKILKNSGVVAITLNTNNDTGAYNFYKKNGYEEAPKAVMMIKLL